MAKTTLGRTMLPLQSTRPASSRSTSPKLLHHPFFLGRYLDFGALCKTFPSWAKVTPTQMRVFQVIKPSCTVYGGSMRTDYHLFSVQEPSHCSRLTLHFKLEFPLTAPTSIQAQTPPHGPPMQQGLIAERRSKGYNPPTACRHMKACHQRCLR